GGTAFLLPEWRQQFATFLRERVQQGVVGSSSGPALAAGAESSTVSDNTIRKNNDVLASLNIDKEHEVIPTTTTTSSAGRRVRTRTAAEVLESIDKLQSTAVVLPTTTTYDASQDDKTILTPATAVLLSANLQNQESCTTSSGTTTSTSTSSLSSRSSSSSTSSRKQPPEHRLRDGPLSQMMRKTAETRKIGDTEVGDEDTTNILKGGTPATPSSVISTNAATATFGTSGDVSSTVLVTGGTVLVEAPSSTTEAALSSRNNQVGPQVVLQDGIQATAIANNAMLSRPVTKDVSTASSANALLPSSTLQVRRGQEAVPLALQENQMQATRIPGGSSTSTMQATRIPEGSSTSTMQVINSSIAPVVGATASASVVPKTLSTSENDGNSQSLAPRLGSATVDVALTTA
ncbi:unnamed protein product, partial [Amoebophrya sp. A25]